MVDTKKFVNSLIENGYTHICAVPCSFAKNLINEIINNENIEYIPSASEAIAVSIAAGLRMSGKKPIVVVQSSGLTNMGSCITSMLLPYGITFPIITSWRTYKEGDSEVQHKHLATALPKLIETYGYKYQILEQNNLDTMISQINNSNNDFLINILKKDTFSNIELYEEYKLKLDYIPRSVFLKTLNKKYKNSNTIFIGTTGNTAREMYTFMPDTKNFYMVGNMGGALSVGVGMAKAGKKVIVLGGDAEFVMHMGGLTTAGRYKNLDLNYILFDNESNKSTGGQATYQNHINYIGIAKNCGFHVYEKIIYNSSDMINSIRDNGLNFLHVKCGYDKVTPRPPVEAVAINKV
ncbi:thiamine pyrophosphate-dependent enzyme [Nitratifractor salsuginis]|uniref:Thiamine pyrophosphate TPP-binding domain-containing protein n=1 Tax=Nitratifractor salsuginis (strain DSM 16511 / JCM 12458 / E9I37-1) TaxID=749222 RepID=E6WZM1_NITSE|nr:thiamine pyrophosphate-dependent enzyme [Nitratifractor salsuginis]ADV46662.1 thiamine pyrophosphate TPP-binding domain-containing protein [Nitratifractor salsuginis DSM 16511]